MSLTVEKRSKKLDDLCGRLDKGLNAALYEIGFLEGTIDNSKVSEKISGSFSGNSLDIAIRAVISNVVLFITRSWEKNGSSIPQYLDLIAGMASEIERKRKEKHPDWPESFLEIGVVQSKIDDLNDKSSKILQSKAYLSLKVHRDEFLAHNLLGKSDARKKLDSKFEPAKYSDVVDLSRSTAEIICEAIRIWTFSVKDPGDWIGHSRENTEMLWYSIPKLSDIEESPPND